MFLIKDTEIPYDVPIVDEPSEEILPAEPAKLNIQFLSFFFNLKITFRSNYFEEESKEDVASPTHIPHITQKKKSVIVNLQKTLLEEIQVKNQKAEGWKKDRLVFRILVPDKPKSEKPK